MGEVVNFTQTFPLPSFNLQGGGVKYEIWSPKLLSADDWSIYVLPKFGTVWPRVYPLRTYVLRV